MSFDLRADKKDLADGRDYLPYLRGTKQSAFSITPDYEYHSRRVACFYQFIQMLVLIYSDHLLVTFDYL
jgi:hypothetical protein